MEKLFHITFDSSNSTMDSLISAYNSYWPCLLISIIFFCFIIIFYYKNKKIFYKTSILFFCIRVILLLLLLLLFVGFFYTVIHLTFFSYSWVLLIINICLGIGFIAFLYIYLRPLFMNVSLPQELNLIKNIILYFPCLLLDLINYLKYQFKITTKTIWIIFFIEIFIILLRFTVPFLYKEYNNKDGTILQEEPVYLNTETNLGTFQNLNSKSTGKYSYWFSDDLDINGIPYNYNYAISCWIWINPQPTSTNLAYTTSTSLLNYGNILKINFNKNMIEIIALSNDKFITVYKNKDILYQKWNNYIINYSGGTLDIFINNNLVVSVHNITPNMFYNKVTTGSTKGIYGGIKNIVYYNKKLSRAKIHNIYNISNIN